MSNEDESAREARALSGYARTTKSDLYTILGLPDPFAESTPDGPPVEPPTESQIKKAWRATALKHHPDKNRGNEQAAGDKLDEAQQAYSVLREPGARAVYDDQRRTQAAARLERERLTGARRAMVERLEKAERQAMEERAEQSGTPTVGVKRGRNGHEESDEQRRARELRAFDADQRRKLDEWAERKRAKQQAEAKEADDLRRSTGSASTPVRGGVPATPRFSFTPGSKKSTLRDESAPGTPSLFQSTMARLREAQRKKEEAEPGGA